MISPETTDINGSVSPTPAVGHPAVASTQDLPISKDPANQVRVLHTSDHTQPEGPVLTLADRGAADRRAQLDDVGRRGVVGHRHVLVADGTRTEVVILDELGYLGLPEGAAELVFQVISERNERGSLICTTNLPFGEWTKVFPDPRLAKAVVDRITHKAHIIDTGEESWRFRHGLERKTRKQA